MSNLQNNTSNDESNQNWNPVFLSVRQEYIPSIRVGFFSPHCVGNAMKCNGNQHEKPKQTFEVTSWKADIQISLSSEFIRNVSFSS